ncbi:MAG: DUF3379 domain-containing protein, partial [Gemmatimonadetes bacterium]|nr:DUF3379 domain-containing protein [Gemmatimonadota bacterium]
RGLLAMDVTIRKALQVPVPDAIRAAVARPRAARAPRHRWYALTASVVAGVLVGSLLWVGGPRASLAREVMAHLRHEPQSWTATQADPAIVARVLSAGGIRLREGMDDVTYANSCPFRGRIVPHLVVRTEQGPVTVLVLRDEPLRRPIRLREDGLKGSLLPAGPGSIAVLGEGPADVSGITARVLEAVEWSESPVSGDR